MSRCGPEVRHLCLRDILRPACGDAAVGEGYAALRSSDAYRRFFGAAKGGVLGDTKRFDLFGTGHVAFRGSRGRGYDRGEPVVDATRNSSCEDAAAGPADLS